MTPTAVLLILCSALIHAGWNLLGKRHGADTSYFRVAAATGFVLVLPLLAVWRETVFLAPAPVWGLLLATGVFQGLYFLGLAGAYRRGELSLAYPVARALPVLLVPVVSAALGTGGTPSLPAVIGAVTVTAGLLLIPRSRATPARLLPRPGGWGLYALVAGIGTTGYSIIDDAALALYRTAPIDPGMAARLPLLYAGLQSASTVLFLYLFDLVRRRPRSPLPRAQFRSALLSGLAILLAYTLVLAAYGFASNVGYVVAFRQISLPIGALLGVLFLKEHLSPYRLAGTLLVMAGLVLVGLG